MRQLPPDTKRLPPEVLASGLVDLETARKYSWTDVRGNPTQKVQTEDGMGKGQTHWEVAFSCPRCTEDHRIHSQDEHGSHVVRCHCDATLVFTVTW